MDNNNDIFQQIFQLYQQGLGYAFTLEFFYQASAVALAILLSHYLSSATSQISDFGGKVIQRLKVNKIITFYELTYYLYFLVLLWIIQALLGTFGLEDSFVIIMMVLTIFWGLLRLTFSLFTYSHQTRLVTFILWLILLIVLFGNQAATFKVLESVKFNIADYEFNLLFILEAGLIFTIFLWSAQLLSGLAIKKITESETLSPSYRVLYTKLTKIGFFALAIFIGLSLIGVNITALAVFTGALGLGAGIGLQHVLSNFVSGFILLLDKSIKPGDTLEVEGTRGIVAHMNARYVSLLTPEGKNILVPNEHMITEKVRNWSFESARVQMRTQLGVSYSADLNQVQEIVLDILNKNKEILDDPKPTFFVIEFGDSAVIFEMRCWIDAHISLGKLRHSLLIEIWNAFKANNIELPYPQRDLHIRSSVDLIKGQKS